MIGSRARRLAFVSFLALATGASVPNSSNSAPSGSRQATAPSVAAKLRGRLQRADPRREVVDDPQAKGRCTRRPSRSGHRRPARLGPGDQAAGGLACCALGHERPTRRGAHPRRVLQARDGSGAFHLSLALLGAAGLGRRIARLQRPRREAPARRQQRTPAAKHPARHGTVRPSRCPRHAGHRVLLCQRTGSPRVSRRDDEAAPGPGSAAKGRHLGGGRPPRHLRGHGHQIRQVERNAR